MAHNFEATPIPLRTMVINLPAHSKILNLTQLVDTIHFERKKGRCIVFTNGCFDILHAGHVRYLTTAKKAGDILVVGLNSDQSLKSIVALKQTQLFLQERGQGMH